MSTQDNTIKKFQEGQRTVPSAATKASKYYPAEDVKQSKKVRKTIRPTQYRKSLQPGTILILLAGRFRGKRVVLLKTLDQGVLLVTGPFKVNGVPLRRVNARYVIATSTKVDVSSVDSKVIDKVSEDAYFTKDKASRKPGEDSFFKQGEKPEVSKEACTVKASVANIQQKKSLDSSRVEDQKSVDKALLSSLKKDSLLVAYLSSNFSLRKGDKPHEMKF